MKRALFVTMICACLMTAAPVFAGSVFFAVLRPFAQYDSNLPASTAAPSAELYTDYYQAPALVNFGWEMTSKNVDLAVRFDLRYDFWAYITSGAYTNIPFIEGGAASVSDFNYPTVGYASWKNNKFLVSLGRRQLKWGPGTYDIALSDASPYLDNLWAQYKSEASYGTWWYNFIAVSFDRWAANGGNYYSTFEGAASSSDPEQKTMLAHRIGFENKFLRVGFGELNMVYGVTPDLQDIGPFLIYHHLYQDKNSNVLMSLSAETKVGPARAFGEFVMDDLSLSFENPTDQPTSMGWFYGAEFSLFGKEAFSSERIAESDYALKEATFAEPRGLTVGFEHYRTTTYLYNRTDDAGKFTVPDHRFTQNGYIDDPDAFFVGFLYGPDTSLDMLTFKHESRHTKAALLLKRLRQGDYGIMDAYVKGSNTLNWYDLVEPVSETWIAELTGTYALSPTLQIGALASAAFGDNSGFRVGVNVSKRFDVR